MQAIIIVDMQEASITDSDKFDTQSVIDRINTLVCRVRQHNNVLAISQQNLVIFIQHDGEAVEGLLPHSKGWKILKKLHQEKTDIIIRKKTNDAFYGTELATLLKKNAIEELIFCGWATDFCVDSSIKSAISKNYKVIVAKDCHTVSDRQINCGPDSAHILSAKSVIDYHNWLWENLIAPEHSVTVTNAEQIVIRSRPQSKPLCVTRRHL